MRAGLVAAFAILAAATLPASAQSILITRAGQQQAADVAALQALPPTDEQISFLTSHGPEHATYTGPLLWTVLEHTVSVDTNPRDRIRQVVTVTGRDGYAATLSLAEIDPELEGKHVLLAYRSDGQPLKTNQIRLVVPGDHRGARSVRDVARIELSN